MKSLIITGANGFLGSHLTRFFSAQGYYVFGTTRSEPQLPDNGSFDVVVHCASQQPISNLRFESYLEGNVQSLQRVLDWMKQRGTKKIITFSSVVVHGEGLNDVIDEASPLEPNSDYAKSKHLADELLRRRTIEDRLSSVCLRMPSVFGADQGGGLVDAYYDLATTNQEIEVYSAGKLQRNMLYVDEIEQVCNRAIVKLEETEGFNLFLIGSSNSLSMGEIATYIVRKTNSRSRIHLVEKQAPVPSNWFLRLEKVQIELGFVPRSIEDGINRYVLEKAKCL